MLNSLKHLPDPGQEGYLSQVMALAGTALASGHSSANGAPGAVAVSL